MADEKLCYCCLEEDIMTTSIILVIGELLLNGNGSLILTHPKQRIISDKMNCEIPNSKRKQQKCSKRGGLQLNCQTLQGLLLPFDSLITTTAEFAKTYNKST